MIKKIGNSRSVEEIFHKIIKEGQVLQEAIEDKPRVEALNFDALFDQILELILIENFSRKDETVKKLFNPNIGGPLVSLTHKARLLYALGIIDKTTLDDFLHLHNIRNRFAHSVDTSFSDSEVCKECQKLSTAKGLKVTTENSFVYYKNSVEKIVEYMKKKL